MIFTCKNCDGNVIYNPKLGTMYCPHCSGTETQEKKPDIGIALCRNCNAELLPSPYTSAMVCPACGTSVVFDERVQGEDRPTKIIPFKISREDAIGIVKKHIAKRIFTPDSFLAEEYLQKIKGTYVPFWVFDFDAVMDYEAIGTRVRKWSSGNYEYTETSKYLLTRSMDYNFMGVPADASIAMDDERMDLLEPFDYAQMTDFDEKFMSGFLGEMKSVEEDSVRPRVEAKASSSAKSLIDSTVTGYNSVTQEKTNFTIDPIDTNMDLFPIWEYSVPYNDEVYTFHVNGQTGKVVGETPISKKRVVAYSGFMFTSLVLIAWAIIRIMGVVL